MLVVCRRYSLPDHPYLLVIDSDTTLNEQSKASMIQRTSEAGPAHLNSAAKTKFRDLEFFSKGKSEKLDKTRL
jgi:hypothetical protein